MKYFKSISILAIIVLISFNSCKDKEKNSKEEQNEELSEQSDGAEKLLKSTGIPEDKIELNKLPANVADYVAKNYSGYEMKDAVHDPLCKGGDAIDVVITKKSSPNYSLIFLPDGTFVQLEEDVDVSKAPLKIIEAIKNNYSGYKIAPQIEKLTLANDTIQYLLDITKDKIAKEVIFNRNGTVACEN